MSTFALYAISFDVKTLQEIDRVEVLRDEDRLIVERMLEFPTPFVNDVYKQKQAQYKNALVTFQVLQS